MAMATISASTTAASRHLLRHQLTKTSRTCSSSSLRHIRIGCGKTVSVVSSAAVVTNKSSTVITTSRLQFADTAGLRRTKNSGRHTTPTTTTSLPKSEVLGSDPHSIANERVSSAATFGQRTPGTESVATLTTEQKLSNYAMASGLLAFVSYIFYYSLASVGGAEQAKALLFGGGGDTNTSSSSQREEDGNIISSVNPGFEEFLKEANEGRAVEEKRMKDEQKARREASELAELESSTAARLKAQGMDDASVAGSSSASDEEEREMARVAGFVDEGGVDVVVGQKRPIWKRVVFFWRRE